MLGVEQGGMPWPQTGTTHYQAQLGPQDKGHAIKGLIVCYDRDLEPLDLLNGLTRGCYQPSPYRYESLYENEKFIDIFYVFLLVFAML